MGKRLEDGTWQDSCLDKVQPGEPIFVLRSTDYFAPLLVAEWATQATKCAGTGEESMDQETRAKAAEAFEMAAAMLRWQNDHGCKIPD